MNKMRDVKVEIISNIMRSYGQTLSVIHITQILISIDHIYIDYLNLDSFKY